MEKIIQDYVNLGIPKEKIIYANNPVCLYSLTKKRLVGSYDEPPPFPVVNGRIGKDDDILLFCLIYSEIDDNTLKAILEEEYIVVTPCDGGYRYCTVSPSKLLNVDILALCVSTAIKSLCKRSRCGSIIMNGNKIIGIGHNSQPCNIEAKCFKDSLSEDFKSDKTCCVHAEQRAIMDALKMNPSRLEGSTLYFIRLDNNNEPLVAGKPYCTICSKMALDVGIKEFCLWEENGWKRYDTKEYNDLSFKFK